MMHATGLCIFSLKKLILSFSYEVFCILEHLWFFTKQGWTSEWKTGEKKSFFTHERNSFKKSFEWCCRSKDSAFILSLFEGNLMKKLLWCIYLFTKRMKILQTQFDLKAQWS